MKKFEVLHQLVLFNGTVVQHGDVIEEKFVTRRMKELGLVKEIQTAQKVQEVPQVQEVSQAQEAQEAPETPEAPEAPEVQEIKKNKRKKGKNSEELLIDDSSNVQVNVE